MSGPRVSKHTGDECSTLKGNWNSIPSLNIDTTIYLYNKLTDGEREGGRGKRERERERGGGGGGGGSRLVVMQILTCLCGCGWRLATRHNIVWFSPSLSLSLSLPFFLFLPIPPYTPPPQPVLIYTSHSPMVGSWSS